MHRFLLDPIGRPCGMSLWSNDFLKLAGFFPHLPRPRRGPEAAPFSKLLRDKELTPRVRPSSSRLFVRVSDRIYLEKER